MDRGNYEGTYAQAEVTGEGPFDYREMGARKDAALSGVDKNLCYPNISDINLGVMPGEPLVYRKGIKSETRGGAQRLHVFSSFNGSWFGRFETSELHRRTLGYAGCSKTQINYGEAQGGSYQTQTGLSWIKTGESAFNQNTGNEVIVAGDLVMLDMPPRNRIEWPLSGTGSKFVSPNNPSGGTPNGKFLMVTRPFNPMDFRGPLETYSALFNQSKTSSAVGGVRDISFAEFYKRTPNYPHTDLSCAQKGACSLLYGIFGIFMTVTEVLKPKNNEIPEIMESLFKDVKDPVVWECVNACLQENAFTSTAATNAKAVLNGISTKSIQSIESTLQSNARGLTTKDLTKLMCHDAIQNLFGANAEMAYEQNRWILGRAEKNSGPGQKLVVNVGAFSRPSSY